MSRAGHPVRDDARPLRRALVVVLWLIAISGAGCLTVLGIAFRDFLAGLAIVIPPLVVAITSYATVGAILALRRPRNRVGTILLVGALIIASTFVGYLTGAMFTMLRGPDDPLAMAGSVTGSASLFLAVLVVGPGLALQFPTGIWLGPRWRTAFIALLMVTLVADALGSLKPGPLSDGLANNPFGIDASWVPAVSSAGATLGGLSIPLGLALAVAGVVVRYRRSRDVERLQLRWFVGANLVLAAFLVASIADGATGFTIFDTAAMGSFALPPLAVGVAVMRYRLYDLDRLISRTLAWAIVTAILAAVFAAGVIGLQTLLGGVTQEATLAVAASTLLAFALFQPLRRRVQRAVDRRFDRGTYDAERTVERFGERLRAEVDLETIRTEILACVSEAVRPASAGITLHGVRRGDA